MKTPPKFKGKFETEGLMERNGNSLGTSQQSQVPEENPEEATVTVNPCCREPSILEILVS